jgi:hypothetical protein
VRQRELNEIFGKQHVILMEPDEVGELLAKPPAGLLSHFEDHYWDSLEPQKDIVLKHVRSILDVAR